MCNSTFSTCGAQTRNSQRPSSSTIAPSGGFGSDRIAVSSATSVKIKASAGEGKRNFGGRLLEIARSIRHQKHGAERRKRQAQRPAAAVQRNRRGIDSAHVPLPTS